MSTSNPAIRCAASPLRYQQAIEDGDRVLADALAALVNPAEVVPLGCSFHPPGDG